jgi:aminoglycoside 6'-N-acetyltransferase I
MRIIDLTADNEDAVRGAAALLVEGFARDWPGSWSDMDSALEEVREALSADKICRIALNEDGQVIGWVGGLPEYNGNVWELHPLVVAESWRGRGVGRALVDDLEARCRERGGVTMILGTDDVTGMTSLSGVDLYPDPWPHIASIQNLRRHPYTFYQKLDFTIIGVIPDANGPGKPDILMAKRIL